MFWMAILCFLSVVGIIRIIEEIIKHICYNADDYVIVIQVKNQQDRIEGIVRSVVWKELKCGGKVPEILIVDMGSSDDTLQILEKLNDEYDFITVSNKEKYVEFLEKKGRKNGV